MLRDPSVLDLLIVPMWPEFEKESNVFAARGRGAAATLPSAGGFSWLNLIH
jgi:hypothetical protein